MSDIATIWDVDQMRADWRVGDGDLVTGSDLQTAISISLFTDRLARSDDVIDGTDRRGWWGDNALGSRLWILRRQRLTTKVAIKSEDFAKEALQWLIDDGVVSSISVSTSIVYPQKLILSISYQQPSGINEAVKYSWVWEQ